MIYTTLDSMTSFDKLIFIDIIFILKQNPNFFIGNIKTYNISDGYIADIKSSSRKTIIVPRYTISFYSEKHQQIVQNSGIHLIYSLQQHYINKLRKEKLKEILE